MTEKDLIQIVKDYRIVYPSDKHTDIEIRNAAIRTQK